MTVSDTAVSNSTVSDSTVPENILPEDSVARSDSSERATVAPHVAPPDLTPPAGARPARRRLIHVLLVAALAWSGVMLLRNWVDGAVQVEGAAPDFTLHTFDGTRITLAELEGRGVVLNFWASWCGPCRAEAELLQAASGSESDAGVVFVGINYQDSRQGALAYLAEFGIDYANGPDLNNEIARSYGVRAIPDTLFIDAQGQIQGRILGPVPDHATLEEHLARIRP